MYVQGLLRGLSRCHGTAVSSFYLLDKFPFTRSYLQKYLTLAKKSTCKFDTISAYKP